VSYLAVSVGPGYVAGDIATPRYDRRGTGRPAAGAARRARLAFPVDRAAALVAGMVQGPPPPQLQALIDSVAAGCGLHLYIPN
jgi:hypothetical protein